MYGIPKVPHNQNLGAMSTKLVPWLIVLAGYIGLDSALRTVVPGVFGRIPHPAINSPGCWIAVNLLMTAASGPSVPGSLLLTSALIGLTRGLCAATVIHGPPCEALSRAPSLTAPILLVIAISLMFKRFHFALFTWPFMFAAWVSLLGALCSPASGYTCESVAGILATRPWLPLALSSSGYILAGLLMMRPSPPPPSKSKTN